jgi:hypothetical protein
MPIRALGWSEHADVDGTDAAAINDSEVSGILNSACFSCAGSSKHLIVGLVIFRLKPCLRRPFGKVGLVAVVGNEDGAHHVAAELYQALNDLGFSLGPTALTYWVGEAMTGKEYSSFKKPPEKVATATAMAASGAAHLARLLKANPYPGSDI